MKEYNILSYTKKMHRYYINGATTKQQITKLKEDIQKGLNMFPRIKDKKLESDLRKSYDILININ